MNHYIGRYYQEQESQKYQEKRQKIASILLSAMIFGAAMLHKFGIVTII